MKSGVRLIIRKMRLHIPQLLGLVLLLTVGVCFFITLFTIAIRYEETAEQYFKDSSYADLSFYGSFDKKDLESLSETDGIRLARGKTILDVRDGERIFRIISLTAGINRPYLYDGRLPENKTECILLKRNAEAMGLSIGDTIPAGGEALKITGLASSAEYIYLSQNERNRMAKEALFGVIFVTDDFFTEGYHELIALTDDDFSWEEIAEKIGAERVITKEEQGNHILYRSDLEEIRTFSYIFPLVFAVLIFITIYVMLTRTIKKDRRQIGTMKALGASDRKIIGIYLSQFSITAMTGALLGCLTAVFLCDSIIHIFSSMFEVPGLSFAFYPGLWLGAIMISVLLCMISGLLALFSVLSLLPAHAMRPQKPKGGKKVFSRHIGFFWERASFNTRYALKNTVRNKGRFLAVVFGMCGSLALFSFSLGFYDSIENTKDRYFKDFANYDVIISLEPLSLEVDSPVKSQLDAAYKALMMPVDIGEESCTLLVAEEGFDMMKIPGEALREGIVIPEYYAELWDIKTGDELSVNGERMSVSAVIPQHLGLMLFTGYDYLKSASGKIPPVYNTVFGRSERLGALDSYLKEHDIRYTSAEDDKTSFDSIMESMSVLIWFMIACSVILGFTVLYSVGLINLSAREYEYMFMGVMGYSLKSIMTAHIKETVFQLILSVPLGFLAGNLLLDSIKGEFSGNSFVIADIIYPKSYLISAISVIGVTGIMALMTSRHIGKLDIVEGLKAQED